jgi:hypothetical protein
MRLARIATFALLWWVAVAIASTGQGPQQECYLSAEWTGQTWVYGSYVCLEEE